VKTGQPGCKIAHGADHLFELFDKDPVCKAFAVVLRPFAAAAAAAEGQ